MNRLSDLTAAGATRSSYSKVVVPVAGQLDERVLGMSAQLAHRLGAELEVVSVVSPGLEQFDAMETLAQARHAEIPLTVRLIVDDGDVADDLVRAIDWEAALMCLGAHGGTAVGDAVFGSIAADVIRRSTAALVVVGPLCAPVFGGANLAVALDGTQASERVVESAVDLAGALGLGLQFAEVIAGPGLREWTRRAELTYLNRVVDRYRRDNAMIEPLLLAGSRIDDALVELTADDDIAMLAMSTHGVGRFERLIAGSVTMDVIRRARVPILIRSAAG